MGKREKKREISRVREWKTERERMRESVNRMGWSLYNVPEREALNEIYWVHSSLFFPNIFLT